jgi:phage major head subunit gpT-like protein
MGITTNDFPRSINRADLEIKFSEGLKGAEDPQFRQLIEVIPAASNAKEEVFYGDHPRLRRWKDERQPGQFNEYKLTINADAWEATRVWKRSELNRDASGGILRRKVMEFGNLVETSKMLEFWEFLHNGTSIKGFDKANLYDANHRYVDSKGVTISAVAAQSNLQLGGSQLDATTLRLEEQHYSDLLTDQNKKWGLQLTHVAVYQGSANHKNARELNNSQFTVEANTVKGQMTTNVFQGSFDIITFRDGFGASEWLSFALNLPEFKPVKVLSETMNPGFDNFEFETNGLDTPTDDSFWRDHVGVGVKGYWDYNPGYWFTTNMHGSSSYSFTASDLENQRTRYPNLG